ncbi:MAG: hypothetical protein AABW50_01670 [Nanoarchaeota archaeon]
MLKSTIVITVLILALSTILLISNLNFIASLSIFSTQKDIQYQNIHSFTKAICDENNFCQDNLIECEKEQIKSISPITGAFVQFNKNWKDPRSLEQKEKLC